MSRALVVFERKVCSRKLRLKQTKEGRGEGRERERERVMLGGQQISSRPRAVRKSSSGESFARLSDEREKRSSLRKVGAGMFYVERDRQCLWHGD